MHHLACPKCHEPLILDGKSYRCQNGHCYDIAKQKYINLLLNPDTATNNPGDNKESLLCYPSDKESLQSYRGELQEQKDIFR